MAKFTMKEREIPLNDTYDVIIAGGGPAGCTAAAASAREGAKTLLIEASASLGGLGTIGMVPAWCPFSDKEKIIYRGLAEKVFNASKAGMKHVKKEALDWVPIDPEGLKRIYDQLVSDAGADVLFGTLLCEVEAENGTVNAIITGNKSGLTAFSAKCYIDCTGDGDLCVFAGADYEKGGENGRVMPSSLCFSLSNVDMYGYAHGRGLYGGDKNSPIYDIAADPKYTLIKDSHCCNNITGPGTVGFNAGHLFNLDATDTMAVSKAYMQGRLLASQFRDALAEYAPEGFANAYLSATAPLMGIRESRRIIGDYVLNLDDYIARRDFEDEICRNSYFIDIHNTLEEFQDRIKKGIRGYENAPSNRDYAPGESHGIPYRCLTPKGLKNVLVAGRSISCDQTVQGSVRVMPVCLCMGEAAGIAAAHTAESPNHDVHSIDVSRLRARLLEEGAYIK